MAERVDRVDDLAGHVRASASGPSGWLPNGAKLPAEVASDVTVWRAAHGIPDSDTRPTGPQQADFTTSEHQRLLDQRVGQHVDRQGAGWLQPIIEIVGRRDEYTPVLAERLAELAKQGEPVHRLLELAAAGGNLPDDHPTAALDSRLTRILSYGNRPTETSRSPQAAPQPPRMDRPRGGPGIGR